MAGTSSKKGGACKRRSRTGYKARYERYKLYNKKAKNKILKANRHERKVAKQKILSEEKNNILTDLIDECNNRFKLGKTLNKARYLLKRIVGTVSKKKLETLLDKNLSETEWFRNRRLTPSLKNMLKSTKFPFCELMMEVNP